MTYFITNLRYVGHLSRPKWCVGMISLFMVYQWWTAHTWLMKPGWFDRLAWKFRGLVKPQGVGGLPRWPTSPYPPNINKSTTDYQPIHRWCPFFCQVGLVHYRLILWFFEGYIEHHRTSQMCLQLFIQQQATSYWGAPSCQNHGLWESRIYWIQPHITISQQGFWTLLYEGFLILYGVCMGLYYPLDFGIIYPRYYHHYYIIYHLFIQYIIYSSNILLYFILFIDQINMVI